MGLRVPHEVERLTEAQSRVSREKIEALTGGEESQIYFGKPPFRTVAEEARTNRFWSTADPQAIDPAKALIIGDFGLGSDAPIILDYRVDPDHPLVLRLRYVGPETHWIYLARDVAELVRSLGIL